jgi:rubrerythrin
VVNPSEGDSGEAESNSYDNTRRQFVSGSVGALGALAVGGAFTGSVLADEHDEEESEDEADDSEDDGGEMEDPEFEDDVAILNYALTLEYLEARFYRDGLDNIGEEALCNCRALEEDSYLGEQVFDELRTIQEHEESHVETLVSTIESLGGEPVEEPEFDFGLAVQYPMAFLSTAAQLEDIGVSAYAGAAPYIENEDLVEPALGIHSVEARHASFLRTVTGQTGFPNEIDEPRTRSEVLELAGGFIVGEGEEETADETNETANGSDDTADGEIDMPDETNETSGDTNETPDGEIETPSGNASDSGNETAGSNETVGS